MMLCRKKSRSGLKLPPVLKQLLDPGAWRRLEEIIDLEVGPGKNGEKFVVVLRPIRFDIQPADASSFDVGYREMKDRDPEIFEFFSQDEKFSLG